MLRNFNTLMGCTLAASDGEIGKVREMYFDDHEWTMRYLVVTAGSWLTGRDVLIAPRTLGEIDAQNSAITVNLTQEQVRSAPSIDTDQPVSRQFEARYYQHYGWDPYWVAPGGTGMMLVPSALAPAPAFAPPPEDAENLESDVPPEPEGDPRLRSSHKVRGYGIHAQDGEFGHVSDFVIDDADWRVRYLVIATRNWLPGKHVLVAPEWIERISYDDGQVFVNLARSIIKEAPDFDPNLPVSRAYEQRLHDHYARKAYWDAVQGVTR
jgi:hypothetical protein